MIDNQTNEVVDSVPVGIRPGPIAAGAGFVWVGNLQDRTLSKIDPRKRAFAGTVTLNNRTPTGLAFGSAQSGWHMGGWANCRGSNLSSAR